MNSKVEKNIENYIKTCAGMFPVFVKNIESYCNEKGEYRDSEAILHFALTLMETFGPFPSSHKIISYIWYGMLAEWARDNPPCRGLEECGTKKMSTEQIRTWFVNSQKNHPWTNPEVRQYIEKKT